MKSYDSLYLKSNYSDVSELLRLIVDYRFLNIVCFDELEAEITVHIDENSEPIHVLRSYDVSYLKQYKKNLSHRLSNRCLEIGEQGASNDVIIQTIRNQMDKIDDLVGRDGYCEIPVLGEFIRSKSQVILYLKNIEKATSATPGSFIYQFISTYVHEMFHAWYYINSGKIYDDEKFIEIEEAMVEFAMLSFLKGFLSSNMTKVAKSLLKYAEKDVSKKKYGIGPIVSYGFGHYIYMTISSRKNWEDSVYEFISNYIRKYSEIHSFHTPESELIRSKFYLFYPFGAEEKFILEVYYSLIVMQNNELFSIGGEFHMTRYCTPRLKNLESYSMIRLDKNKFDLERTIAIGFSDIRELRTKSDYSFYYGKPKSPQKLFLGTFVSRLDDFYRVSNCNPLALIIYQHKPQRRWEKFSIQLPENLNCNLCEGAFARLSNLLKVVLPNNVFSIPRRAFVDCANLQEVIMPGVWEIGEASFSHCYWLRNIDISKVQQMGEAAFNQCCNLSGITLPLGITILGDSCFKDCKSLVNIDLPDTVTKVGSSCFKNCTQLSSFKAEGVLDIEDEAFYGCSNLTQVNCPAIEHIGIESFHSCSSLEVFPFSSVRTIGKGAFAHSGLTEAELPYNITSLPPEIFKGCNCLVSVNLASGTRTIGRESFGDCSKLEIISNITDLQEICERAFYGCKSLVSVILPDGLQYLGEEVFNGCESISSMALPSSLRKAYRAFANSSISKATLLRGCKEVLSGTFYDCFCLTEIVFEDEIMRISSDAFNGCSKLNIVLPETLIEIGEQAFAHCDELQEVSLSSSLRTIGQFTFVNCKKLTNVSFYQNSKIKEVPFGCFMGCSSLESLTLPDSIEIIQDAAFMGCYSLQNINRPQNLATIGEYAFLCGGNISQVKAKLGDVQKIHDCAFKQTGIDTDSMNLSSDYMYIDENTSLQMTVIRNADVGYLVLKDLKSARSIEFNGSHISKLVILYHDDSSCISDSLRHWDNTSIDEICLASGLSVRGCCFKYLMVKCISLPSTLITINESAFYECRRLEELRLPEIIDMDLKAFRHSTGLKRIVLTEDASEQFINKLKEALRIACLGNCEIVANGSIIKVFS